MCALREITYSLNTSANPTWAPVAMAKTTQASGMCTSDNECTAKVRSRFPDQSSSGVELCQCYAASSTDPFDECEDEDEDDSTCMMAKCADSCAGFGAHCVLPPGSNEGTKMCALRETTSSPTTSPIKTSSATPTLAPIASTKTTQAPTTLAPIADDAASTPSPTIDNRASSSTTPAPIASAQISLAPITQASETGDGSSTPSLNSNNGESSPTTPVPITTTDSETSGSSGTCTSDSECTATVRSRLPNQSSSGVGLCACYAASSTHPFDECEGEDDSTCKIAKCVNSCAGLEAHCLLSLDSVDGTKMCALRESTSSPTKGVNSIDMQSDAEPDALLQSAGMLLTVSHPVLMSVLSILLILI